MSGHVYYRFKSQKEFQRIMFEGIGISVWDLKREIIQESKMGKGTDFDFAVYNADTDEEYANDHAIIPRSSSVIARRLPPKRPGHGNAQQYVGANLTGTNNRANPPLTAHVDWRGGGAISKDFRHESYPPSNNSSTPAITPFLTGGERDSEAESMAAMFAAQDQQWQKTQETMATATRVGRNMGFRDRGGGAHRLNKARENGGTTNTNNNASSTTTTPANLPTTTNNNNTQQQQNSQSLPPQGYICYRCGQKGHWIQACPTNDNPEFEGRPRIKRTTGIPKSFLQKVEDGKPVDGQNVMVTADGSFVIVKPDNASWKQHKSVVVKNLSAADIENQRPSDPDLVCPICLKLLKKSVKMICCSSSFCESCISNYLKSHSSVCPECETKVSFNASSNLNNNKAFIIDEERRKRSEEYIQEILKISQAAQLEQSNSTEEDPSPSTPEVQPKTEVKQPLESSSSITVKKEVESGQKTPLESKDNNSHQPLPNLAQNADVSKDNPKPLSADKIDHTNQVAPIGSSSGNDITHQAQTNDPNDVQAKSPVDFKNTNGIRSSGLPSASSNSSHMPIMMNGMMDFGANDGYGSPLGMQNGAMMGGMGMNMNMGMGMGMDMAGGMGFPPNGMMMGGMPGNHNVVGFGGGMGMDMGAGVGPDGMLAMRLNQIMVMLQNPQLNEPMRMQLLMQQLNLQQQLAMMQRMGGGGGPMMEHNLMNGMGRNNGMMMNNNFTPNPMAVVGLQQQEFNHQNNHFGPFGMGDHHINRPPMTGFQPLHHANNGMGGMRMNHLNQSNPMMNQFNNPHSPQQQQQPFQRPTPPPAATTTTASIHNNNNNNNGNHPRRTHWNNNSNHHHHPYNHPHLNVNLPKRKRPEDLIELESGEKVPRYM